MKISSHAAVYVISVAAELAGMHPQTLRQYDRLGLVQPQRTAGRGRRYSAEDIAKLQEIQQLSQDEGINLAGIKKIMALKAQVEALGRQAEELRQQIVAAEQQADRSSRVFAAGRAGDIISIAHGRRPRPGVMGDPGASGALVLYRKQY